MTRPDTRPGLGRAVLALALAAAAPAASAGAALVVVDEGGRALATEPLGPDTRWCLVWNHSVTGIEVADCFRAEGARLVLERSHQPDYAAGLGDIPGRGSVRSDGAGGYWIEGIEAPLPPGGLVLRLGGPAVAHRLRIGDRERALPTGRRGERVTIRVAGEG